MGASLRDVARRAGVSVKTVSNVVNGYTHVSEAMRARVQAALDELDYRPNIPARRLRAGRSGIVALAVPSLDVPYFAELAGAVFRAAERRGVTVLVEPTDGEREHEASALTGLRTGLIDGVLLSPLALRPEDLDARPEHIPVVLLGERLFDVPVDHVAVDNVGAARAAVRHLIDVGRRRIAFLGAQLEDTRGMVDLRLEGYAAALREAGLPVDPALRRPTPAFDRRDGLEAMQRLLDLDDPPDAVFCVNDLVAVGALRALALHGVAVPGGVAVCGFDDSEEGRFATPSLTSIAPDKARIAELAVARLLRRVDGSTEEPVTDIGAGYRLVVRESTAGSTARPGAGGRGSAAGAGSPAT